MGFLEGFQEVANIHPMFVHFPIALLLISGAAFFLSLVIQKDDLLVLGKYNLIVGSGLAVLTVITGMIAEEGIPHNGEIHDIMEIHEKIMISVTVLSLLLTGYLFYKKDLQLLKKDRIFLGGLGLVMLLLAIGADYGGTMVYKYGAGTKLFKQSSADAKHDHGEHKHNDH